MGTPESYTPNSWGNALEVAVNHLLRVGVEFGWGMRLGMGYKICKNSTKFTIFWDASFDSLALVLFQEDIALSMSF